MQTSLMWLKAKDMTGFKKLDILQLCYFMVLCFLLYIHFSHNCPEKTKYNAVNESKGNILHPSEDKNNQENNTKAKAQELVKEMLNLMEKKLDVEGNSKPIENPKTPEFSVETSIPTRDVPSLAKQMLESTVYEDVSNVVLRHPRGDIILNKRIKEIWQQPLRKWNHTKEVLSLLHISKCGGNSLKTALLETKFPNGCGIMCANQEKSTADQNYTCPLQTCTGHFDWTRMKIFERIGLVVAPIAVLRNPIDRFVSNFYFTQYVLARNISDEYKEIENMTLNDYLNNPSIMWKTRQLWRDGASVASWFAGTHIERHVVGDIHPVEIYKRNQLSANWSFLLDTTIENLHKCLWIGILEEIDNSIEMLNFQTGLGLTVQHQNSRDSHAHSLSYTELSPSQVEFLKKLMPVDMYLYEYARQLFGYRWKIYQNERNRKDEKEKIDFKLPETLEGCKITSQSFECSPNFSEIVTFFAKTNATITNNTNR